MAGRGLPARRALPRHAGGRAGRTAGAGWVAPGSPGLGGSAPVWRGSDARRGSAARRCAQPLWERRSPAGAGGRPGQLCPRLGSVSPPPASAQPGPGAGRSLPALRCLLRRLLQWHKPGRQRLRSRGPPHRSGFSRREGGGSELTSHAAQFNLTFQICIFTS